jgi:hypothetical protein
MMTASKQLQTNNKTFLGRYFQEYSILRRRIRSDKDLSILSFGCATGEELATIRSFFPAADLFGCDIDWYSLQRARALLGSDAVIFDSSPQEIARHGPYDIIICNSVLLQPTGIKSGRRLGIDPALWADVVGLLDSVLKDKGILQIINSNIPFRLHPVAANYQVLPSALILTPNFVDQFSLEGEHLCSAVAGVGLSAVLSRHLGEDHWSKLQPTDLQDVHFQKGGAAPSPALDDEHLPNLPAAASRASGSMTYDTQVSNDRRPSTHLSVELAWHSVGTDAIHLERTARRTWFDGSIVWTGKSVVEMAGTTATAFIEAALGRRSSRLSLDDIIGAQAIRAPTL